MARPKKTAPTPPRKGILHRALRWLGLAALAGVVFFVGWVALYTVVNPSTNIYMMQESRRLGGVEHDWADWDEIAPVMARSVVASEDANFCLHWGFDMGAIRQAIEEGGNRGASTLTQQVVKNVFLWHGRNYTRKAMEALLTPLVELLWSKRRILEVYLNVAEFGEGTFGVKAAARRYFDTTPDRLTAQQAGRLAAVLPDPKDRNAGKPGAFVRKRGGQVADGAATIRTDGRAACFED